MLTTYLYSSPKFGAILAVSQPSCKTDEQLINWLNTHNVSAVTRHQNRGIRNATYSAPIKPKSKTNARTQDRTKDLIMSSRYE